MRDKIVQFMMGRYGTDTLNKHILYVILVLIVLNLLLNNRVLYFISYVLIAIDLIRTFSKNISARSAENARYEEFMQPLFDRFKIMQKNMSDKEHKYFICANCHKMVRVPKGKGKIEVTCPRCGHHFDARS